LKRREEKREEERREERREEKRRKPSSPSAFFFFFLNNQMSFSEIYEHEDLSFLDFSTFPPEPETYHEPAQEDFEIETFLAEANQGVLPLSQPHILPKEGDLPWFVKEEMEEEAKQFAESSWEKDLQDLIAVFDHRKIAIDDKVKEELLKISVKEFNRRSKSMRLEPKLILFLKNERKKIKNRQAAVRSRGRKETKFCEFQKREAELVAVTEEQRMEIENLQKRIKELEDARASCTCIDK